VDSLGFLFLMVLIVAFSWWIYSETLGQRDKPVSESPGALPEPRPLSLTVTYKGKQAEATAEMVIDAEILAEEGYVPVSQQYVAGEWTMAHWIGAFVLLVVLVGIIVLAYMVANRPPGALTVVYERRLAAPHDGPVEQRLRTRRRRSRAPHASRLPGAMSANHANDAQPLGAAARLRQLQRLRDDKLITDDEYASRRQRILDDL
jgi:hypothetical protein